MERSLLRGLVMVVAVLGAAACGEVGPADATGDDDDDGGSGQIDSAIAQRTGSSLAASAESGARAYDVRTAAAFVCDSVTSMGDSDSDGVPDFAAIEHQDCSKMTPWGQGLVTGDEAITDNQPTVAGIDYSLAQSLEIALGTSGEHVSFDATQVASKEGALFAIEEATVILHSGSDVNGAFTNEEELAWSKTYEPSSAWMPGEPAVAGLYSVDGAYQITFNQADASTVVQAVVATEEPLQLDPSCSTLVVAGKISAIVGDGSTAQILEVTWTGCNASGTELLPAP